MVCPDSGEELVVKAGHEKVSKNARGLLKFFSENKENLSPLLILTHDYPDPDGLASAFALHYIATKVFGVESKIVYGGIIRRMENRAMVSLLKIPARKCSSRDLKRHENIALVDTQPGFKNNPFPKNRKATMVIDQHEPVGNPSADFSVIDTECGATSVILCQTLLQLKIDIPVHLATALTYGILSDTLNLYRAEQPHISRTYLDILPHCDFRLLARIQNPPRSRDFFATLNRGIYQAMIRQRLIVSHLGFVSTPDLISQTADFLLAYKAVKWAFVTGRHKGKLHVSLRVAKPNVDASEILRDIFQNRGDAGGHDSIAGGCFKVAAGSDEALWEEAEGVIAEKLVKRLRLAAKSEFYYPFRKN